MESLTKAQILALLAAAKAHSQRNWLMVLVAFGHGLRASELVGFKRDAVADGYLTIQRLKGSLRTTQPLIEHPDPLLDERKALEAYVLKCPANQPVFNVSRVQFWRLVQRYSKAAGIPKHLSHPHILKHSIAMQTIHSAGIENVRQYLGHRSLSSTGAYLKVSDAESSHAIGKAIGLETGLKS